MKSVHQTDVSMPREAMLRRRRRSLSVLGVGSVITATADLDSFDGVGVVAESVADEVGIGIAQGPHPDFGDSAIWIVILLANRR